MTDKEIGEIRRRIAPDKNNITTIRGRYINSKHETVSEFSTPFFMLGDEDSEKYLAILRRTLSGTNGKNLIDIAFSMGQVESGAEHALLQRLRKSALKDDEAVKEFFDKTAPTLSSEYNSLILLACDTYDVPIKRRDEGDSDSEQQFSFILCAVCPVKEAKATFAYDPASKVFRTNSCNWNVGAPELGFMFPAFDDRKTNIYNALYYSKDISDSNEAFSDAVFHTELPLPAESQRQIFEDMLSDTLGEECSYSVVQALHDDLSLKIEEHKASHSPEQLLVSKREVKEVLSNCGVTEEKLAEFDKAYDEKYGAGADLQPRNIIEPKRLEIETSEVKVKIAPERGDLIETRIIDGVKYVLIRADEDITVNGVLINIPKE